MKTINQIKRKLKEIQENHLQLNSFHFGSFSEIGASSALRYNLLAADLLPGGIQNRIDQTKLTLAVAGLVNKDDSNLVEVLSDTKRILLDVFAQFWEYLEVNDIELIKESPISDFREEWDDEVAGHQIEISINQFFSRDTCQVPSTLEPATDDDGNVIIYDQEGSIITRLNDGQSYMVLRFSGIHGGAANTTYTNSIVGA